MFCYIIYQLQEALISDETSDEIIQAKLRELNSWKAQGVFTEEENNGQNCMSLRWVVTPKIIDGKPSVKARLVARGFEEVQNFRTDSPTCSKEGLRIALTVIASNGWSLHSLDVKTAFLQGKEIDRELYVKPPKEAETNYIWKLHKTVYGLADASRSWYLKLKDELLKLGAKPVNLDQGIFLWFKDSKLVGIMVCFVDDVLWGGDENFKIIVKKLKQVFHIETEHSETFSYIGIHLQRQNDGTIIISQQQYVDELEIIHQSKERLHCDNQEPVNDCERKEIRKAIGKLNWLAGMTRPEISFTVSDVSSRITSAKISDIKLINKTIKFLKTTEGFIKIPKLDVTSLKIKVFTDASFNNLMDGQSQGGHIVLVTDSYNNSSVISWSSNKVRRVVRSTLAAETLSFADGAESAIYFSNIIQEFFPVTHRPFREYACDARARVGTHVNAVTRAFNRTHENGK